MGYCHSKYAQIVRVMERGIIIKYLFFRLSCVNDQSNCLLNGELNQECIIVAQNVI